MAKRKPKFAQKEMGDLIRKTYEGLPVVDATKDREVAILPSDVTNAAGKEKDFEHCVIAQACIRSFGSTTVLIGRQFAYADIPENGGRKVFRYMLDSKARSIVEAFDSGLKVANEVWITLKAPTAAKTLDYKRKAGRKYEKARTEKRKARLLGTLPEVPNKAKFGYKTPRKLDASIRNGSGVMVKMTVKKGKAT